MPQRRRLIFHREAGGFVARENSGRQVCGRFDKRMCREYNEQAEKP